MSEQKDLFWEMVRTIICILFLIPYLVPENIADFSAMLESILDFWQIGVSIIVLCFYIFNGRFSKFVLSVGIFEFIQVFSTILNAGALKSSVYAAITVISFCMYIEMQIAETGFRFIQILSAFMEGLVICNLITIFIFPNGMYVSSYAGFTQNWILGYDNTHSPYILLTLMCFMICAIGTGKNIVRKAFGIVLFAASTYITWSGSAVVAITIWVILWLLEEGLNANKLLNIHRIIVFHVVFFFGIVVIRMQQLFSWLIVDILGKSLTFTNRVSRWDTALRMFWKRPLLGWGIVDVEITRSRLAGFSHCHNHFLQILYQSGLIGMACFFVIILLLNRPLREVKNSSCAMPFLSTILALFIVGQVEVITNSVILFGIFALAYHAPVIEESIKRREETQKTKIQFVFHRYFL